MRDLLDRAKETGIYLYSKILLQCVARETTVEKGLSILEKAGIEVDHKVFKENVEGWQNATLEEIHEEEDLA